MRALIVEDGEQRSALAAVRDLGAAGWSVSVAAPKAPLFSRRSRWTRAVHLVSDLKENPEGWVRDVAAIPADVIFPSGDAEALALSGSRDRFSGVVALPPHDVLQTVLDKVELQRVAERAGFAVPELIDPDNMGRADLPVIVKPRRHGVEAGRRVEASFEGTIEGARERIASMRGSGAEVVVQKAARGSLSAYIAVVDRSGCPVVELRQFADRIWPSTAGVSTRAHTHEVEEGLSRSATKLFQELGWWGLAELQFVGSDGRDLLIDLNGRFYGSLSLGAHAGIDLARAWAAVALEETVAAKRARPGVRYQWLEGDLRRALEEGRGSRTRDVASTVAYAFTAGHSVWSWRDPRPAAVHLGRLAGRALRKAVRR